MIKSFLPIKIEDAKLVSWKRIVPKSVFKLEKDSRAGIVLDKKGIPKLFIFDANGLLDILSEIDEKLLNKFSDEKYTSRSFNPAGWFIDEIESKSTPNSVFIESLKKALNEAKKKLDSFF
jgi:6-pyruvoyl-tetrahydropterin synthase